MHNSDIVFSFHPPHHFVGFISKTMGDNRRDNDRTQAGCPAPKRSRVASPSLAVEPSVQNNPCVSSGKMEDMVSGIQVMKVQEATTYKTMHYLDRTAVTEDDRERLCQWGFDVLGVCKVNHSIAVIAIGYFDRFLSIRGLRVVELCLADQRELQLAFLTCLVIALKARESMEVDPNFVAESMCQDMYLAEEIIAMEIEILRTLGWHLNGPTAKDFIQSFMKLLPTGHDEEAASSFFDAATKKVEASLLDYSLALELPSSLALASVASLINALDFEAHQALCASAWMARVGFVMGALSGGLPNQDFYIGDEDATILTRHMVSDDEV